MTDNQHSLKESLRAEIDRWISEMAEAGALDDMLVSDTLVSSMTEAAWSPLMESRGTQEWLKKTGVWNGE